MSLQVDGLHTPVAVFLFNRPERTAEVLGAVRKARPRQLLLVADGPRPDVPGEREQCAAARAVFDGIDWECDITTDFAPANLGLKERFDTGLNWVFEQVERAIILEDDCLPGLDFFLFCQELLERYAGEERVFSISGRQHCPALANNPNSYYFSRYPMIWGWATWRRAWRQHDPAMGGWPAARAAGWLTRTLDDPAAAQYWSYIFETTYQKRHTWDYGWVFSSWLHDALSIHPRVNLVRNTGFGPDSTHTRDAGHRLGNLQIEALTWPLRHPVQIARDEEADACLERLEFGGQLARVLADARERARKQRTAPTAE